MRINIEALNIDSVTSIKSDISEQLAITAEKYITQEHINTDDQVMIIEIIAGVLIAAQKIGQVNALGVLQNLQTAAADIISFESEVLETETYCGALSVGKLKQCSIERVALATTLLAVQRGCARIIDKSPFVELYDPKMDEAIGWGKIYLSTDAAHNWWKINSELKQEASYHQQRFHKSAALRA